MPWRRSLIAAVCLVPTVSLADEARDTCTIYANTYAQSALIHHFGPVTEEQALTFLKDSYRNIPIPPWEMDKLISIVKEAFANEKGWDNDVWSRYYNKCMKEESGGGR